MKICVLEICPHEPSNEHQEVFSSPLVDYFYVSYKQKSDKAIAFNKNQSWGFNRNCLYEKVRGKYDYYFFIDYDIVLESKKGLSPLEHIINTVKKIQPAMYRPSGFNGELKLDDGFSIGGFINHSVTIFRADVAENVFKLPIKYGGFWDAASYINTVLVPLYEESIVVDYSIIAHNMESSGYAQNKIPFIGMRAMNKLYKRTKKHYTTKVPSISNVKDFKEHYEKRRKVCVDSSEIPELRNVQTEDFIHLEELKKELNLFY